MRLHSPVRLLPTTPDTARCACAYARRSLGSAHGDIIISFALKNSSLRGVNGMNLLGVNRYQWHQIDALLRCVALNSDE